MSTGLFEGKEEIAIIVCPAGVSRRHPYSDPLCLSREVATEVITEEGGEGMRKEREKRRKEGGKKKEKEGGGGKHKLAPFQHSTFSGKIASTRPTG